MKTLTMAEYTKLMQLIPKTEKTQALIRRLVEKIKKKDKTIRELNRLKDMRKPSNLSNEQNEVIDCLMNGLRGNKYSPAVRAFCLRQQFYSNAAYESLRLFFNKNLPTKRTIQMWYRSVDGSPGISTSALEILRVKVDSFKALNNHDLHAALISDEMAIRKHVRWCSEKQTFEGFVTVTNTSDHIGNEEKNPSKLNVAKDALVFLVVGTDFKLAVAYHLLDGLESIDRAALTLDVIRSIEEVGVIVMSHTSDGLRANVTVAELLGADFNKNQTFFHSPTHPNQKIYFIFDPPHMLKLVRKHFSTENMFFEVHKLDWNLLRILVAKQSSENFNLCNKLTQHHIDWHQKPMNVRLAAETISRSVANALETLNNDGYDEFKDSASTVQFLRYFNDAFDLMNFAEKDKTNGIYKQSIREESVEIIFAFFDEFESYVKKLTIERKTKNGIVRKPILKSTARMGFFGFLVNVHSIKGIYKEFVKNGPLNEFYTMQFGQDHLESLFSLIRNSLGCNTNPNAAQFRSAFRKILICRPVITSKGHNIAIRNETGILTASSAPLSQASNTITFDSEQDDMILLNYDEILGVEIKKIEPYDEHMFAYVAQCLENKIIQSMKKSKKSCSECINALTNENEKISDPILENQDNVPSQIKQPCISTRNIVIFTDAVIRIISPSGITDFNSTWKTIFNNINLEELYSQTNFEDHQQQSVDSYGHKEKFVMEIIRTYMTMKSDNIGQRITDEERGAFVRSRLRALTHNSGQ